MIGINTLQELREGRGSHALRCHLLTGLCVIAFLCADGGALLSAQQSALELRYLAFQSGDIDERRFTREVLTESALQNTIDDSLSLLRTYGDRVRAPDNSIAVSSEIALLAEMTARYDVALESYHEIVAASAPHDHTRYEAFMKIALLHFNNGDFDEAAEATREVLLNASHVRHIHRAHILSARIEGYGGDFQGAIRRLRSFIDQNPSSPDIRLAYSMLAELYHRAGDDAAAARTNAIISERFPSSIEARYANTNSALRITNFPIPAALLGSALAATELPAAELPVSELPAAELSTADERRLSSLAPSGVSSANSVVSSNSVPARSGVSLANSVPSQNSLLPQSSVSSGNSALLLKIQVGSFQNQGYAESLQGRLSAIGLTTAVEIVEEKGSAHYKVRILSEERAYQSVMALLARNNIRGFVVKE